MRSWVFIDKTLLLTLLLESSSMLIQLGHHYRVFSHTCDSNDSLVDGMSTQTVGVFLISPMRVSVLLTVMTSLVTY